MTAEEYQAAVSSGLISPEIQAQISAAVEAQMADGSVQQQIKENTEKMCIRDSSRHYRALWPVFSPSAQYQTP